MTWPLSVSLIVLVGAQAVLGILNASNPLVLPNGFKTYPCLQLKHRLTDLEPSVMGQWFVIEIVQHPVHHPTDNRKESKHWSTQENAPICPKITLYKPNKRNVKLTWAEKEGDVVYSYELVDPENPGYWVVNTNPTGSSMNPDLKNFAGSTQVIEAQSDRMVLTFCQSEHSKHERHFSAVLVRNATAGAPHDTNGSRRQMTELGLAEESSRRTCEPGSMWEKGHASRSVLSIALAVMCAFFWVSH